MHVCGIRVLAMPLHASLQSAAAPANRLSASSFSASPLPLSMSAIARRRSRSELSGQPSWTPLCCRTQRARANNGSSRTARHGHGSNGHTCNDGISANRRSLHLHRLIRLRWGLSRARTRGLARSLCVHVQWGCAVCVRVRSCLLSADASDDDEDNFYDANEYQAAHGSSPGGTQQQTAHTAAAAASAAQPTATAASNGEAAAPAEPLGDASVSASSVAASLADAAAAPSPDSAARALLASKAAHAALRVAPPAPQATTAPAGISIDTGSTPQPTGSPAPQPSPTNASANSVSGGGGGSVAPAPSRPPRPSYSVPGSAGTTPQSVARPLPPGATGSASTTPLSVVRPLPPAPGSKNSSPNVTLTGPILPTAARPPQQQSTQPAAASAAASTTVSPHAATQEPSVSSTAAPSTSATSVTAAASPPPPFTIKNLDTGETCDLQEASTVFPEVNRAMTLEKFEAQAAAAAASAPPSASVGGSSATPASTSHASSTSDPKVSVEEVAEKKKTLGFLSRIKQALHIKDDTDNAAGDKDKAANLIKVKTRHKPHSDFTDLKLIQTLSQHAGPIWTVSVSAMGDYIATGGQDSIVRVWAVMGSSAAREVEEKLRNAAAAQKANQEAQAAAAASAAAGGAQIEVIAVSGTTPVPASSAAPAATSSASPLSPSDSASSSSGATSPPIEVPVFDSDLASGSRPVVYPVCFRSYAGHKADVIDLAWSKANFLLSASIDKTVRLWHVSRQKCLCVFQHADFVTAVAFHPIEDRYFVSGSFDKKLRIWNIPEHRVVEWAQTSNIITAATFNPNGSMTVAGLYNGAWGNANERVAAIAASFQRMRD